jgi:hypothetical protein
VFLFGSEMHLEMLDAHFNRLGEAPGVRRFSVVDPLARKEVCVTLSRPARLWHFPIEGVSGNGASAQRVYQGLCMTCLWPVRLAPGGSWRVWMETVERKISDVQR